VPAEGVIREDVVCGVVDVEDVAGEGDLGLADGGDVGLGAGDDRGPVVEHLDVVDAVVEDLADVLAGGIHGAGVVVGALEALGELGGVEVGGGGAAPLEDRAVGGDRGGVGGAAGGGEERQ